MANDGGCQRAMVAAMGDKCSRRCPAMAGDDANAAARRRAKWRRLVVAGGGGGGDWWRVRRWAAMR